MACSLPSASHSSKNMANRSVVLITHTMSLPILEQCALLWDILLSVLQFFSKSLSLGALLLLYTFFSLLHSFALKTSTSFVT